MRKILGLFLILVFTLNTFSAPLIFKAKKEILTSDKTLINLGEFDTGKFTKIRIIISASDMKIDYDKQDSFQYYIGLEGGEDGEMATLESWKNTCCVSLVLDAPPSKMRVRVWGKATFNLYVYGVQ